MTPTDADRQRAREVAHAWIDGCYEKWGHIGRCNLLTEEIAAAIAAARAEGLADCAQIARDSQTDGSDPWAEGWNRACGDIEAAIRALKEPGHGSK